MSHHIYQTDGFILKGREAKDANRFFTIFTKDLGLIGASAQGVRLLKSKLRYSLQDFSLVHLSLVRGREVWRITSAGKIDDISKIENFSVVARIFSLLDRLLAGEEKNADLFDFVLSFILFIKKNSLSNASDFENNVGDINNDDLKSIEILGVMRVLLLLGYFTNTGKFAGFISCEPKEWDRKFLDDFLPLRLEAIQTVNNSLKESQL